MPELNWIGKAAVVKHHKQVPFRLLEADLELSCGDPESGNLIIEGDNLHALKALLLGIHEGRAIYLLYNGILKDRKINGGNVLTGLVLSRLPPHDGAKVIYTAANKLVAPRCQRENITFKQTPYALDV